MKEALINLFNVVVQELGLIKLMDWLEGKLKKVRPSRKKKVK